MSASLVLGVACAAPGCNHGADVPGVPPAAGIDTSGWPFRPMSACRVSCATVRDMACVPAGPFTRGNDAQPMNRDEYPKTRIDLPAFRIDRREVSVRDYLECVAAGACDGRALGLAASSVRRERPSPDCNAPHPERKDHPINCVSWVDAYRYCAAVGKRLPSEAEWEKTARGDRDDRQAPWGSLDDLARGAPKADLADRTAARARPGMAIFDALDDAFETTAPVGSFPGGASPYRVLDMLGNVAEWVFDAYDVDAYFRSPPGEPVARGDLRVYRGHAWSSTPTIVRLTRRGAAFANDRDASTGFRCAMDVARCGDEAPAADAGAREEGP